MPRLESSISTATSRSTPPRQQVGGAIDECNADPAVSGILLQLPVPPGLDGHALTARIAPDKDVDGLTAISAGRLSQGSPGLRPCTPTGIIELLDSYNVALEGAEAVVVGRSDLVGKAGGSDAAGPERDRHDVPFPNPRPPRGLLAMGRHPRRREAGVPELIGADHVKLGATVIDVGMNRTPDGLRGDVAFDAARERAGLITPVPGGVGPMTIAMLLSNTVAAFRLGLAA